MIDTTKKITAVSYNGVNIPLAGGGGVSTQSQSFFTGYTAPLTWLNSTNNVFTYESATHDITISGLDSIATITGNGTKSVVVTINTTASADRQTAFTISCANDSQTLTYNGIAFHYGSDLGGNNCLAVAQTLINDQIGYIFIESASLPKFSSDTATWNSIYSHQLIGFDFGKFNGTSILYNFMYYCYSFNQPLTIPSSVTSIGSDFMIKCYSFNQPLTIPSSVTSIGDDFMNNCQSFNQQLTIPNNITMISSYFMSACYSFNQPLTIPSNVTTIAENFMRSCTAFNQPLSLPNNITMISTYFMQYCYSFNQPLTIPSSVTTIGAYFMNGCYSFNQPLTISSNVTSIGTYFMNNCYSFVFIEYNASVYPTDNYSLSQTLNTKTSSSGTGIKVVGTNASGLKSALPNRTSSPYRKLV